MFSLFPCLPQFVSEKCIEIKLLTYLNIKVKNFSKIVSKIFMFTKCKVGLSLNLTELKKANMSESCQKCL